MKYKIGKSTQKDAKQAIEEAAGGLKEPKLILFYSGVEQFEAYTIEMKKMFPDSIIMGSTTYVSLCKEGAYKDTLMVLGIEEGIECFGDVLEEVDKYPLKYVRRVENCVKQLANPRNTICLEFSTALISSEELILSTLNSVLGEKKIPLIGGSAGDHGVAEKTMVSLNGIVYDKACVFVLIRNLKGAIKLYKENIYEPTEHHFIATKVDVRKRIVHELNHEPAAKAMAKALNTRVDQLGPYLDNRPLGRIIGNDMYITANQMVLPDNSIAYHARVYSNSQVVLLQPASYKEVIEKTIEKIRRDIPHPSIAIMIHCLARSILFEQDGYINAYARKMGEAVGDYVAFSGYGEQLNEQHFNQTMAIAVFE